MRVEKFEKLTARALLIRKTALKSTGGREMRREGIRIWKSVTAKGYLATVPAQDSRLVSMC